MNVLMLSADPKLADPHSGVSKRLATYGTLAEQVFIVVTAEGKEYQLAANVFVYPVGRGLPMFRTNNIVGKATEIIKANGLSAGNTIITSQDPFDLGEAGVVLKNKFGMKLEMQIHGDIFSPWFAKESLLHRMRVSKAPSILAKADRVRAVSFAVKESLVGKVSEEKIYVLPIAIDKNRMQGNKYFLPQKYPGLGLIMLTVARLESEKNVAGAIRLLKNILTIEPRAGLIIVGDGSLRKNLISQAKKLGISSQVAFEGWQDNTEDFFASCHLYLQTSFFEGYGMAIAEAALAGRCILSTDVGIAHDLAKVNAALVAPVSDDKQLFEQAKVLLNQEKRTIMGIAAQRVIDSFIITPANFLKRQGEEWQNLLR